MKIKNILKLNVAFILFFAVLFSSCEKWIDTDINISPNNPSDVPMSLLLPSIEANMAFDLGGNDLVRPTNLWMQYFNGWARQSLTEGRYSYKPSNVNNLWEGTYNSTMMDIQQVLKKAKEKDSPHYAGVAKVCLAYTLATISDVWGDIPYSKAFLGNENLAPAYDSQADIYTSVQALLTEAINDLSVADADNVVELEGDLIYGNNTAAWIKAAYSLKARYAITLSKVNGNAAYTEALGYLSNAFTSNADNFSFTFTDAANHPLYMFMDSRGDINMASTFIDMLNGDADFRILEYSTDGFNSVGADPGTDVNEDIALPGDYAAAKTAQTHFITYAEVKFIEAEALLATGDADGAYQAYLDGCIASTDLVLAGVVIGKNNAGDDVVYSTDIIKAQPWYTVISVGASNLTQELIMKQKYIAGYNTSQPYVDWRRTGFPALSRANGATTDIPRRFPYPQSEHDYNVNMPGTVSLQDKLWWDQ